MFDVHAVKESFSRAAAGYDEHANLQRAVRESALVMARSFWKNDSAILDIGCGTGALHDDAAVHGIRWELTEVDLSIGMCAFQGHGKRRVVNADASQLPFGSECFDGVFSSLMLQWSNDIERSFGEIARMLAKGNTAVLTTLTDGTLAELRSSFADSYSHVSPFLSPQAILGAAENAGLALVVASQEKVTEYYPDTVALMRALQSIGASHKQQERKRGLMTPKQFARVEHYYAKNFGDPVKGLPATWQVFYLVLRKK